jgi:hypothetical protein
MKKQGKKETFHQEKRGEKKLFRISHYLIQLFQWLDFVTLRKAVTGTVSSGMASKGSM